MTIPSIAPFPYFGGKNSAVPHVWAALGDCDTYIEPFCGSAAVLLGSDRTHQVETINDADGFVSNFWRSVQADPESVARWADWPVIEADLEVRHAWLVSEKETLRRKLECPDFYDTKIAGYWVWGMCAWVGSGWCSGTGPWVHDGNRFSHIGSAGQGINRNIPHLGNAGKGINRKIPHIGSAGKGINRNIPHLGNVDASDIVAQLRASAKPGKTMTGVDTEHPCPLENRRDYILMRMRALQARLRHVRVLSGDWSRAVCKSSIYANPSTKSHIGVYLDPPYGEGKMDYGAGGNACKSVALDVWNWACEHAQDDRLRIVVSAYEDGRTVPPGWTVRPWKTGGRGYAVDGANVRREVLYCSPQCVEVTK